MSKQNPRFFSTLQRFRGQLSLLLIEKGFEIGDRKSYTKVYPSVNCIDFLASMDSEIELIIINCNQLESHTKSNKFPNLDSRLYHTRLQAPGLFK